MPVAVIFLGGLFWRRPTADAAFWAMVIGFPIGLVGFFSGEIFVGGPLPRRVQPIHGTAWRHGYPQASITIAVARLVSRLPFGERRRCTAKPRNQRELPLRE